MSKLNLHSSVACIKISKVSMVLQGFKALQSSQSTVCWCLLLLIA